MNNPFKAVAIPALAFAAGAMLFPVVASAGSPLLSPPSGMVSALSTTPAVEAQAGKKKAKPAKKGKKKTVKKVNRQTS